MEAINSVSIVYMTVDEISERCVYFEENRCHFTNDEEAEEHYFSNNAVRKTISRIKGYKNKIFKDKKVWKKCCPMIVYEVDGLFYIVDGQGRFEAVKAYNAEVDESEKITKIPVHIYKNMTYEEMVDDVLSLNKFQRNWDAEDAWRSERVGNGEEEQYTAEMELYTRVQNTLGVNPHLARLIVLGVGKASHRDSKFRGEVISPYCADVLQSFCTFYDIAVPSCNGKASDIRTIKSDNVGVAFESIIKQVIKVCEAQNADYTSRIQKVSEILGTFIAQMDREYAFGQNLKNNSRVIKSCFVKAINKKTQDRYIQIALSNIRNTLNK